MTTESDSNSRAALWVIVLLALAAHAPSLSWGFFADDYAHQLVLTGRATSTTMRPWSLYDFGFAPRQGDELFERAAFPWWTSADWQGRFVRPLTSLSIALDSRLFGANAFAYHATQLVLLALTLLVVHRLYLALGLAPRTALLALAIWAFEDGSATPVGWIANRNAVLEAFFTSAAVLSALRARERGGARVLAAFALATCSCASKESGVAAWALVACALWRERRAWSCAALALGALYVVAYAAAGFGTRAIFYATPWREPVAWLTDFATSLCAGLSASLTPVPIDLAVLSRAGCVLLVLFGLTFGLWIWRRILRRARGEPWSALCILWPIVALAPEAGAPPSDRLLLVPMIGAAALVAHFLALEVRAPRRLDRAVARALAVCVLPLALVSLGLRTLGFGEISTRARAAVSSLSAIDARELVLFDAPSALVALQPGAVLRVLDDRANVRVSVLQMGRRALRVTRLDARTLDVDSLDEGFASTLFEQVFRSAPLAATVGERWRTPAFEVEARVIGERGLTGIRVRFDRELDDPALALCSWRGGRFVRFDVPKIGASRELGPCEALAPFLP